MTQTITFDCFSGDWHVIPADHTPNESRGYFMLVNSASSPGDVYTNTVTGLCANTSYEFAVWVMNISKPTACTGSALEPSITLRVESPSGALLGSFNAGVLPSMQNPIWRQIGVAFSPPPGMTSVVIKIINTAAGGCGNDIAIDDITVSACGPKTTARINSTNSDYIAVCVDAVTSYVLSTNLAPGFSNPVFQWQRSMDNGFSWADVTGARALQYTTPVALPPGLYMYRMIVAEAANAGSTSCRFATNPVTINLTALPFVQATNYVFGCFGSDVVLFASGGSNFQWSGPNGFTSNKQHATIPKVKYSDAGLYTVTVSTPGGCSNKATTNLDVYPAARASIGPNATICEGKSTTLSANGGVRYRWYPTQGLSNDTIAGPIASPIDDTRYTVTVFSDYGCTDTASVMVRVIKKPVANAGPDKKTRPGRPVILHGSVKGVDLSYSWMPAASMLNPNSLQPSVSPSADSKYILQATSNNGCGSSTDEVLVKVYDKVLIPNAFSPNGDGINDTWIIEPLDLFDESITYIYNRFGQLVHRSNGYARPWDGTHNGKPVPTGNYYYVIDLKTNNEPKMTGWVYVIR